MARTRRTRTRVLLWSSLLFLALLGSLGWLHRYRQTKHSEDPRYRLKALVQRGERCGVVPSELLVEQMGLQDSESQNLFDVDIEVLRQRLLQCPVMTSARVGLRPPEAIWVEYETRRPIALLRDQPNMAVDGEGFFFPLYPYYTPKVLPEIVLGEPVAESLSLALDLLRALDQEPFHCGMRILSVDTSLAFCRKWGEREVRIELEEREVSEEGFSLCCYRRILRLGVSDYREGLYHYCILRRELLRRLEEEPVGEGELVMSAPLVVDLRLPRLAFLAQVEEPGES